MDIDRKQRTDIDTVTNDRLTLAIDESNIEDNPYVHETIKGMEGNNWVMEGTEYVKYNLVEDDNLILMYDPITKLSQKSINKVTVSFDYVLSNNINRPILDNISLVADSTYHEIVNYELNNSGHIDIDCEIFGIDEVVLNTIISIQGFGIGLNFNGKYSNATIRISNVKVSFKYSDKLYDESGSVINRLEPYIDFYRDDDGDLILRIGGDATGKGMDRGGTIDTYSKTEIDNKLATKVDTQIGKGLSSNDYTNAEKTKLSGIAENANYYIHPSTHGTGIIVESNALTNLDTSSNATQHEINLAIDSKINSGGGSVDWSDIQNKPSDYPPSSHNHDDRYYTETEIDTALNSKADVNSLSTVATTGDYDDLIDKPNIPSKISDLTNDSDFIEKSNTTGLVKNDGSIDTTSYSTFSGSYNDLSNKPSIPSKTSDLTNDSNFISTSNTSGLIKNDGTIDTTSYSTFSGSYNDLSNKPSIPSSSSDLSDGSDLVKKSNTSGLLKNDGSVDTNDYITSSAITGKEDTSNKVTSWSSTVNDTHYPSEKLVSDSLATKQDTLISGTNIKTINNTSLLGSGNISIQGGGTVTVDDSLSTTSTNPVQNKVITGALNGKANSSHTHTKSEITDFPNIPSKTSDLTNDSGYITSSALPTKTSDLQNDGDGSNVFVKDNDSRLTDARTPLAHTHLSSDVTDLIDVIYPVGSIYMSVSNTSPQTLFGGTWERIQDKFLLASGSAYSNGATGGSADAIVVQHNHTLNGSYTYLLATSGGAISKSNNAGQTGTKVNNLLYQTDGSIVRTEIANKGSSGTGKNMPPYIVVNVWKRTA